VVPYAGSTGTPSPQREKASVSYEWWVRWFRFMGPFIVFWSVASTVGGGLFSHRSANSLAVGAVCSLAGSLLLVGLVVLVFRASKPPEPRW